MMQYPKLALLQIATLIIIIFSVTTLSAESADDLAKREAQLLSQVRYGKDGSPLVELAAVREKRRHFNEAIATWGLIKKLRGNKDVPNQSSAPRRTWKEVADFWIHRLRRKRNFVARPPKMDLPLRQQLAAARRNSGFKLERDGQIDLSVQVDLDGDLIDEVFYTGRYGPLGERNEPFMVIDKWNGSKYETVWRAEGTNKPTIFPQTYSISDQNGDGWKTISLSFEIETDNVATLYFNGKEAIMLWMMPS